MLQSLDFDAKQYEKEAQKALEEDIHYLTAVTEMADVKEVVAQEAIFSASGAKLIDKGAVIGSGVRERLLKHVLLKPIDKSVAVKDGVGAGLLAEEAGRLIASKPYLRRLLTSGEKDPTGREALRQLQLPDQLGFKLTVMREQLPWLFEQSLAATLISYFLAQRMKLSTQQCTAAMLAGLMHDLGELHTDPTLLDRRRRLTEDERRHIDAHPVTGQLIAREMIPGVAEVATAVMQHHEKLDGSGYPLRLRGEAISPLAQIVSIADACAATMARIRGSMRLSTLLSLNRQKFDPRLVKLLQRGLSHEDDTSTQADTVDAAQIEAAARLLRRWSEFSAKLSGKPPAELAFLFERMGDLRIMLVQFGLNTEDPQSLQSLAIDQEIGKELAAAFDEVRWQITDLQRETVTRRPALAQALSSGEGKMLEVWMNEIRAYLAVVTARVRNPALERRADSAKT